MSYILRNLFQRKVRTGLSMLGVSVSVAGVVALISVSKGLRTSIDSHMASTGATLTVFSRDAADLAFSQVKESDAKIIAGLEGVQNVSRANFTAVMSPRVGEGHKTVPLLFLFGRHFDEPVIEQYREALTDGRMPAAPHEVLAGAIVAEQIGFRVGDRLPIFRATYSGIEEYEIVGIYNAEINWENGGLVIDASIVQQKLNQTDSHPILFVYTDREHADAVQARIEERLPHLVAMPAGKFTDRFSTQMEWLDEFTYIITAIALIVGVLGVLNTMMMSVTERTREIGTLRALGWSRGLVVRTILAEGVLLSLVGGAIGLALGVLGTEALVAWFSTAYLEATYETITFVQGGTVALLVGVVATLYPAMRAADLRPVEALRYE